MLLLVALLLLVSGCVGLDKIPQQAEGSASDRAMLGALELSAAEVAFGDVAVGTTASQDLTLTNTGEAALAVRGVLSSAAAFATSFTTLDLEAGASSVVTLDFAPTAAMAYEGTLTVEIVDGDSLAVPITGAGIEEDVPDDDTGTDPTPRGDISLNPTSADFGVVDVGSESTKLIAVTNEGDADLLVSSVVASNAAYTITGDFATARTLAPLDVRTLEINFAPSAATTYRGTVTLTTDDPDEKSAVIGVDGEGAAGCDVCAPDIEVDTGGDDPYTISDFNATFGADSRTITIQNAGDRDLTVSDVQVKNDALAPCGTFTVSGWKGAKTIAPYDSIGFDVTYDASGNCWDVPLGDANTLVISSNDPGEPTYTIQLTGVCVSF